MSLDQALETEALKLRPKLLQYAENRTRNAQVAEDLVQECYLRAFKKGAYRENTNLRAFLHHILRNLTIDYIRGSQRRPSIVELDEMDEKQHETAFQTNGWSEDDPLLEVTEPSLIEVVQPLKKLRMEFREAVFFSDICGLQDHQIARHLGIPRGTVHSRVHRGRKQLREILTGEGEESPQGIR